MFHDDVYQNLLKNKKKILMENNLPLSAQSPAALEWQFDVSGSCKRLFSFKSKKRMFVFLKEVIENFSDSYCIPCKIEIDENVVMIRLGDPTVHGGFGLEGQIAQSISAIFNNIQFYNFEKR